MSRSDSHSQFTGCQASCSLMLNFPRRRSARLRFVMLCAAALVAPSRGHGAHRQQKKHDAFVFFSEQLIKHISFATPTPPPPLFIPLQHDQRDAVSHCHLPLIRLLFNKMLFKPGRSQPPAGPITADLPLIDWSGAHYGPSAKDPD